MSAYHLRTFYLARQAAWNDTTNLNFFRLEGVTDGGVTVNINDEVIETIGQNVGDIVVEKYRDSEITMTLVATYEQILYILHGLFGAVTPTQNAGLYYYTYKAPAANSANPQLYTIIYAIENDIYQLQNCLISEVSINATVNNYLEVEVTFISPNAPSPIATLPTIAPFSTITAVHAFHAECYLSDINIVPTTTYPVEATFISFNLTINPNRHIKRFIGNTHWYGDGIWNIDGSLTLEFNATSKAIIDSTFTNHTKRNFELRFSPPNRLLSIIVPFIVTDSFELFSDRDGNATVELKYTAVYSQLFLTALRIEVASDTNTLV